MLFNHHKLNKYTISSTKVSSTWCVAWGKVDFITENVAWRDEQFAVVIPDTSYHHPAEQFAISPNEQFVLIGDVWLSNRAELLQQLGINPSEWMGTDCQVIAQIWQQLGCESLRKLVGMFGLVVWDRQRQVLWLGRDRVGASTLYYTTTGPTRWIASALRSLTPYRSAELDKVALRDYLCCAFVPGEQTLWKQVREIRPGTVRQFPHQTVHTYWQLQEQIIGADEPLEWHSDRLRTLLHQVVHEYLPPNQAVGVFLSGGLDSSSVTAIAAQKAKVHTYSIHFGSECPNELEFSSLVAQHCHTQHHILEITFQQMWENLPETMAYLDDPIGDPLTVPNLLLAKLAQESVQVVLNGEGGDPCFGGPKNQPMLINNLYNNSVINQDSLQAYLIAFQKCATDLPQLLTKEVWTAVEKEPSVFWADLNSNANYLNRLMALNIKYKGADHILTKVNNLTQAARLHGLSPLFDQRVVDLSMQIPPEYKLSGVVEKAVLKQAVADLLPSEIIHRPKSGMMVPVQLGFRKYWQREARKLLLNPKAATAPYLNQSIIRNWLDYKGDTWNRYGVKLWLLVSLEIWLQVNKSV
ncbi:asparagine synthase-related protein [Iningainema tapete]|uniref:asparagine synthase (glutamine-hydrolyzing) n=1 Tax=Iningainema tapete BLCC-T55 TaxID=2748662 RepID=A0A8J6XRZ1_9CYAN|nr:7-cyano-7-deazaguanine synthase [Iningainema tapete BLCC-T55]